MSQSAADTVSGSAEPTRRAFVADLALTVAATMGLGGVAAAAGSAMAAGTSCRLALPRQAQTAFA